LSTNLWQSKKYDVFISHASEDKDEIVRPLAEKLKNLGIRVWYDEFTLHIHSIVIVSKNFFTKNWTREELDGLYNKSVILGRKVIFPIWHKVTKEEVYSYSPLLASKVALFTSKGIDYIAYEILQEIMGRDRRIHYDSRSELPPFHMMLSLAKSTIDVSGLDFRIVVHSFMSIIRLHLNRGYILLFYC
jgi:hypothetical protein